MRKEIDFIFVGMVFAGSLDSHPSSNRSDHSLCRCNLCSAYKVFLELSPFSSMCNGEMLQQVASQYSQQKWTKNAFKSSFHLRYTGMPLQAN